MEILRGQSTCMIRRVLHWIWTNYQTKYMEKVDKVERYKASKYVQKQFS